MKKRTSTAVLALALLVATPGAAFADSSSSSSSAEQATPAVDKVINSPEATAEKAEPASPEQLAALKAKASAEIAKRQASLTGWVAKLAAAKADCGQNGPAAARIAATQASLNTLGAAIQAAPTREAAKPLYRQIFTHQRVYLVVGPVVGIALACDGQAVRADKLTKASTAAAGGANTAAAVALLNQVAPLIATGKASATAAAASVNGLAPDQGVEAVKVSNSAAVNAARAQMKQSDASLDAAGRLLNDATKALGGAVKTDRKSDRKSEKEAAKDAEKAKREQAKQDKKNQKDKEKEERKDRKDDKDDKDDDD
jgi:hypothetical protein